MNTQTIYIALAITIVLSIIIYYVYFRSSTPAVAPTVAPAVTTPINLASLPSGYYIDVNTISAASIKPGDQWPANMCPSLGYTSDHWWLTTGGCVGTKPGLFNGGGGRCVSKDQGSRSECLQQNAIGPTQPS